MPAWPTVDAVLKVALSQEGVTENPPGSNDTIYGREYGVPKVAWCGQFVWWCYKKAGIDLKANGIAHPLFTPAFWNEARAARWVVHADAAIQAGDVLFFDFAPPFNTAGIQHTGFALAAPAGGQVKTIEANTSSGPGGSQDNGGGVFRRTRSLDVIVAAVRPPYGQAPGEDVMAKLDDDDRAWLTATFARTVAAAVHNQQLYRYTLTMPDGKVRDYTVADALMAAARQPTPPTIAQITDAVTAALKGATLPTGGSGSVAGPAALSDADVARLRKEIVDEISSRLVR